jgi:hypothetical protein
VTSPVITARAGREPDPGPFRGVPHWLRLQLSRWLSDLLRPDTKYEDTVTLHRVIARLRIPAANWSNSISAWSSIEGWLYEDTEGERLLDVIHVVIQATPGMTGYRLLDQILSDGGSAYAATERGIEDRVDATAKRAFEAATRPGDQASAELSEAWSRAYAREPDPSDAWDHSIKAVEAALRPIVCPNNKAATLSHVIGELRNQPWKLDVRGRQSDHSVTPLINMLELLWPNPDRHGSATPAPPATLAEARAVVQLAVTIVQWARDGEVVRR